jgi:hypothetical protein
MNTPTDPEASPTIDPDVPHPARVYDYLLGGTNNFASDRALIQEAGGVAGGVEVLSKHARSNRAFLGRAVRFLAGEAGIRQFLDIGSGLPSEGNVHEIAQAVAPDSHVVYVDNDPLVLAQAQPLLQSTPEGSASFILGDVTKPRSIVLRAETALDLNRPVALMLVALLHFVPDDRDPYGAVRVLLDALPPGSYLVMCHLARDIHAYVEEFSESEHANPLALAPRTHEEIMRFFDGLELVEPGLVIVNRWRPDEPDDWVTPAFVGVARKP